MKRICEYCTVIAVMTMVSCTKTDNPVTPSSPHYPIVLSVEATSSVTAQLTWTSDSAGQHFSNRYILLRGTSATAITDTAFNDTTAQRTVHVLDSARGALLKPFTSYYYRCVRIKDGAVYDTSSVVMATTSSALTLIATKVTPISASLKITEDPAALPSVSTLIVLRGISAGALTDTVYHGAAHASLDLLDSNNGKWLAAGSYIYQCIGLRSGVEFTRSATLPITITAGDYLPLIPGSVWVYHGYVTDTITEAKKPGSDYVSVDSLLGRISFQGYDDVYAMRVVRTDHGAVTLDTLYLRFVNGDYWEWSRYGYYPNRKKWFDKYRFSGGSGTYILIDTTESVTSGGTTAPAHEVGIGTLFDQGTLTVPAGNFSTREFDLKLAVEVKYLGFTAVHDTVPAGTIHFAQGFGMVRIARKTFMARGTGLVSLARQEGFVEELMAFRIKY